MKAAANNLASPNAWELLHALPQALLLVAPSGHILEVNDAAEQLLGTSRRQLCTTTLDTISENSALVELVSRAFTHGSAIKHPSLSLLRTGQNPQMLSAQACPVFDADHPAPHSVMLLLEPTTPTEQRPSEAASVMAAMLAHEVKNPLSGIRGAAQLLGKKLDEADKPMAELICREVDRITALLQKIEFFSNEPAACNDAINIHEVLEMVREAAQSGFAQSIAIDTRYDPSLPPVRGNKDLLVQLFINLVKNAAEALEGRTDGRITLSTRYHFNHTLQQADGTRLSLPIAITVEDNGCGIPEAVRTHLFHPFVTTKTNGSGLGLAVAARIVADHGGRISLSDKQENQTTLTIRLMAV